MNEKFISLGYIFAEILFRLTWQNLLSKAKHWSMVQGTFQSFERAGVFARIFSHCEITAFSRHSPTAFIFIYHQIPVISISVGTRSIWAIVQTSIAAENTTARECAAASTALRTGESFHKALIKIYLTFQPQLFQAIRPIVLPSSRCPKKLLSWSAHNWHKWAERNSADQDATILPISTGFLLRFIH